MKVAIHQPNYLPWCGFFAKWMMADIFVFLDDVQFSKGSYVNRTRIRSGDSERWITAPVCARKASLIRDLEYADHQWTTKHLTSLKQTYAKAPYLDEVLALLAPVFDLTDLSVADFNRRLLLVIASYLEMPANVHISSTLAVSESGDDRLIALVKKVGGTCYLSGKGGQNYQDPEKFAAAGLALQVQAYSPISYAVRKFPFVPGLSIVDALFLLGRDARRLLLYS